jgi:hypothetical protein
MKRQPRDFRLRPVERATQVGTALLEVLVAIFVMGIGLLALLTLFPLGALSMAEAIEDDRTAKIAADAASLSRAGEELIARTARFVEVSLSEGSVDKQTAACLRAAYEQLAFEAEAIEVQLLDLQFPPGQGIQRYVGPLLAQIRAIRLRVGPVIQLLSLVDP